MKEIIITSSVLILCIMLIRVIFKGKISSRLQYALWILVALRLMIPASAQIYMAIGSLEEFRIMDLARIFEAKVGDVTERLEQPVIFAMSYDDELGKQTAEFVLGEDLNLPTSEDGPTAVFVAGNVGRLMWLDILRGIWIGGMVIVALWMLITNLAFTRRLHRGRKKFILPELEQGKPPHNEEFLNSKDIKKNRAMRKIRIYTIDGLASPCLYGVPFKEAVYLTPDIAKDQDKLRHVLTHEMCHKKHGDSFWSILRSILLIIYWMNPLVWVATVLSKRDCELACDEEALLMLGEEERISYGETLLSIITRKGALSDIACTATTMTGSGKSVKERIKYIANRPRVLGAAVVALLLLVVVVSVLVFTKNPLFHGNTWEGETTLTAGDLQVKLPESIAGLSGYDTDEDGNIIIYHVASGREVGRFSILSFAEAMTLLEKGREVVPTGDYGRNPYLKEYLNIFYGYDYDTDTSTESVTHTYTPNTATEGMLEHSDQYIPDGPVEGVPGTEEQEHIYIPDPDTDHNWMLDSDWEVIPLEEEELNKLKEKLNVERAEVQRVQEELQRVEALEAEEEEKRVEVEKEQAKLAKALAQKEEQIQRLQENLERMQEVVRNYATEEMYTPEGVSGTGGIQGTDSNDDSTTYVINDDGSKALTPQEESAEYLPAEEIITSPAVPDAIENVHTYTPSESTSDYLPNERIIATQPLSETSTWCYVYVKGDYSGVKSQYLDEIDYINSELEAVTNRVIVVSINRELREQMFETLAWNRIEYLGDHVKVSALVRALSQPDGLLQTETTTHIIGTDPEKALDLTVGYRLLADDPAYVDSDMAYFNAVMLFATVKNLDCCNFVVKNGAEIVDGTWTYHYGSEIEDICTVTYYRADLEKELGPLWSEEAADSSEDYAVWLDTLYANVTEHLKDGSVINFSLPND